MPTASPTVLTVVAFAGSAEYAASHWANCANRAGEVVGSSEVSSLMWWKVSCTQPPLSVFAWVTCFCRSARVQSASTWLGARVSMALRGGRVSAVTQPVQSYGVCTSPRPRALVYPQARTASRVFVVDSAKG